MSTLILICVRFEALETNAPFCEPLSVEFGWFALALALFGADRILSECPFQSTGLFMQKFLGCGCFGKPFVV